MNKTFKPEINNTANNQKTRINENSCIRKNNKNCKNLIISIQINNVYIQKH